MTDSLPPSSIRRIAKELSQLRNTPPEGIRVVVDEEDITSFGAWVEGPAGTPYQGGYFRVGFSFGPTYPSAPPKCTMVTKIFHPNVSKQGEICVDTLKKGWQPDFGISHVLSVIRCLLIYPNPESALDEEAGKLLLEAYEDYCKHARIFTSIHATPKRPPPEFSTGPSSTSSTTITQSSGTSPLSDSSAQPQSDSPSSASLGAPTAIVKPVVKKPAAKKGLKRL